MRRWTLVMVPVVLLAVAGTGSAQTRRAPSIADAVRKAPPRQNDRIGVTSRGVNLPQERCSERNDRRYERYDRDRDDGYGRNDGRYDRYDSRRSSTNSGTGSIDARGTTRGTITKTTSGAVGRVNPRSDDNRTNDCGDYRERSGRDDRRRDSRYDPWPTDRRQH
ncbi:MAG: hypothetical protein ABIS27_10450 [Longimicrobiales bacterium]